MTREDALRRALAALHAIGGAMQIRRLRDGRTLNDTMRRKLDEKALTDKQVEDMALASEVRDARAEIALLRAELDAWKAQANATAPLLPKTAHVIASRSL